MAIDRLKKKDIDKIFREGKNFKEDFLVLKMIKNNLGVCRSGFIISRKVSKKASVRNKIRRRLREVVSAERKEGGKGWDALFVVLPGAERKEFGQIKETVGKLLKNKNRCLEK